MTQISISNVRVDFGATTLFKDVTFTVAAGERWGIVGRNGSGKTTLFNLITGTMEPTQGAVVVQPGARTALLEQHREFGDATTVWEAAAGPFAELLELEIALMEQAAALGDNPTTAAMERYGRDLERFEHEGGYTIAPRVDAVLHGLGFDPALARTTPLSTLSGGERGRLGVVRQLVTPADILLLDEPTNHLDLETTRWLEQYLTTVTATVLLVSHDRAFLSAVVDHVLHLENDTATAYTGNYEAFVAQRQERRLAQQRAFEQQQRTIAKEQDYIARNIAGQNSRQAKGRRTRLGRMPRLGPPPGEEGAMAVRFESGARGGDRVAVAEHATIAVDSRVLVRDFTGTVMRGDVLALIGQNGAGKSTLVRSLLGEHPVTGGELRLGAGITAAHYRQDLTQVPLDTSLYDAIAELRPLWERRLVQGHLGRFGFSGDEVQRRASTLSGGERARLALAMLMLGRANLLILDEPTNHLDVESIEALEDAVEDYEGTVILVSHDRALLRALTTRVWHLRDHHITDFDGGFAEWETVTAEREHAAQVRAAEEEALRRVQEKKKTARRNEATAAAGSRERKKRRDLEQMEAEIEALESQIQDISATLEDPALYTQADGVARASEAGKRLEQLKAELDRKLEAWTAASD